MYGKIYEQTFTGSMCGKGPVKFAVWAYIIANTKADHLIEINPKIVAHVIGCKESEVAGALKFFCSPDKESRNTEHGGRKLIRHGEFLYFVTGHGRFRGLKDDGARKEYMREYMRERRQSMKARTSLTPAEHESTNERGDVNSV
jgi:hypothetical protein